MKGCRKVPACYQTKSGYERGQICYCLNKKLETERPTDNALERMRRETEDELEQAKQALKIAENVSNRMRGNQDADKSIKKSSSRCTAVPSPRPCKPPAMIGNREAIKRLSKVETKEEECARIAKSGGKELISLKKRSPECEIDVKGKAEFPKKPNLTYEQLESLLQQETKDVESVWVLTSERRESHKKPCPKQEKVREAVKALMDQKKLREETHGPCVGQPVKEPGPLIAPDPDEISPEIAASMMFIQERGIKMENCPEDTINQLFWKHLATLDNKEAVEDMDEEPKEGVNDAVYTRSMSKKSEPKLPRTQSIEGHRGWTKDSESKREIFLQEMTELKCINRVQLRGNFAPWFPGYYAAFPDQGIQLAKSPSGIFQKAWLATKPSNVSTADVYVID